MTTTQEAIDIIKRGAANNVREIVKSILDLSSSWRPSGFDSLQKRRRDHYTGHGKKHIDRRKAAQFPQTHQNIPTIVYNWTRHAAVVSSSVYDRAPRRWLADASGAELPADDARAIDFAETVLLTGLNNKMAECERRAHASGGAHVVMVRPRPVFDGVTFRLMPCIDLYWAHDVMVVPSQQAPADIQQAHAVMIRIAGDGGQAQPSSTFELWTRDEDDGRWYVSQVTEDGKAVAGGAVGMPYPGAVLPILVYRTREPDVGPWVDAGSDDVDLHESINVAISDAEYTTSLQSHTMLTYVGSTPRAGEIIIGPDRVNHVLENERVDSISLDAHSVERNAAIEARLVQMATVERLSPGQFVASRATVESGVARLIANEPQDKARAEQLANAEVFERALGAVIVDVHDKTEGMSDPWDARMMFQPVPRPAYEDESAKQSRAIEAMQAGLLSPARAGVAAGLYASLQDAMDAGLADVIESPMDMSSAVPQFTPRASMVDDTDNDEA